MRRLFSAREAGGWRAAVSLARAYPGLRSLALAALVGIACTACAETVTKHGHLFQESELKQITPGMSSEQVKTSLGTPTTTASVGSGSAFYYISSVESQSMFFAPTEKDRRVVAVYFSRSVRWTASPSMGSRTARCSTTSRTRRRRRPRTRAS